MNKPQLKSQRVDVLNYLKEHKSITSMEAFETFGITRLASVIYDLREDGYWIDTIPVKTKTRYNRNCKYAKYVLEEKTDGN